MSFLVWDAMCTVFVIVKGSELAYRRHPCHLFAIEVYEHRMRVCGRAARKRAAKDPLERLLVENVLESWGKFLRHF